MIFCIVKHNFFSNKTYHRHLLCLMKTKWVIDQMTLSYMMNNISGLCHYMVLNKSSTHWLFFKSFNQTLRNDDDSSWSFVKTVSRRDKCLSNEMNDITQGRSFAYAVYCDPGTHTRLNVVMRDCFQKKCQPLKPELPY